MSENFIPKFRIKFELEDMTTHIQRALLDYNDDLQKEVNQAFKSIIENFNFEDFLKQKFTEVFREEFNKALKDEIASYLIIGEGRDITKKLVYEYLKNLSENFKKSDAKEETTNAR